MSIDPYQRVPLGRTGVSVTRLGFGAAPIGGLYEAFPEADAVDTVRHAWQMGIRYFDVAPLYGYGAAERRVGLGLAGRPRDDFALSTKVGRLLVPVDAITPDMDVDHQAHDDQDDFYYQGTAPVRPVFDYSYDGVMRSVEASLLRLGLDRIDILYIHDPDDHREAAMRGAYPALERLRSEGSVGAIGLGMNVAEHLAWFARQGDFDVFMVAGRYTLLDQAALPELLPLCLEKGIAVVIAGVMNSGILADPRPGSPFNYAPADAVWVARAQRLRDVCERHGVPLKAVAVQFVFAHPAVVSLAAGVRRIAHLEEYPTLLRTPIPAALWDDLRTSSLLAAGAPTPAPGGSGSSPA